MKKFMATAFLSVSLLLAACGNSEASKIDEALAAKFTKKLCINEPRQFPHASPKQPRAWLQPLVDAGLLDMEERPAPFGASKQYIYTMTEKAVKQSTDDGFFCYGQQKYLRVEGLPETKDGFQPGQQVPVKVVVQYDVTESWAKKDAIKNKIKTGEMTHPAVLTFKKDGTVSVFK
ncbi:MAG TPA: hypothetical protein VHP34_06505 [Alphaproteobacteria bacterium]|nr:hypothetical protein [Alphaproteobacteria bacterium]